jgi:ElaB/YqjD/DUF883 family membrane-anchored ribosome-binding protein
MDRLSMLLGKELEYYKQIQKQTEEQTGMLSEDDIEAFNESLLKREGLINKIKGLHQEKEPLMQSYASMSKGTKPQNEVLLNKEIDDLNKQIRAVIEACAKMNDTNIQSLKEKTEKLTKKIDEQSTKRKGIGGYVQTITNTSEMFDKKS